MNGEKNPINKNNEALSKDEALREAERLAQDRIDATNEQRTERGAENRGERSQETLDKARNEALEQAKTAEKENATKEIEESPAERRRGPISKKERKEAFDKTMNEVRKEMSPASRTFSKVIHNPVIEKTSEVIGNTAARPNAILAGSLTAFVLTAAVYMIAKHYGYVLSGAETIAAFVLGWAIGLVYDYVRLLIAGREK